VSTSLSTAPAKLVTCLVLAWHMHTAALECISPATEMARVELLFGAALGDGSQVSDQQWHEFVAEQVTPRFPEGLTAFSGHGQWRQADGRITREVSRLLLIWYTPTAAHQAAIETIRAAYKRRFQQLSVMRIDGSDCVSF
jgi:hypothetical protein